jgi:putative hydrolase of the HAD superfamily
MNARPPRFFYFDLGNVLLFFDHEIACRQMADVASVSVELVRAIVFQGDLQRRYELGEISTDEFYEHFCAASKTRPDQKRLVHAAAAIFEPNAALEPIVAALRSRNHRVGILSNTCEAHWEYVADGRFPFVRDGFDVYALSYRMRSMKPDPAIYAQAAQMAGSAPAEIFFVDDRADNVAAGRDAGFDAVPYSDPQSLIEALAARGIEL